MSLKDDLIIMDAHIHNGTAQEFLSGKLVPLSQDDKDAAEDRWDAKRARGITS